jgi:hypothetical protein
VREDDERSAAVKSWPCFYEFGSASAGSEMRSGDGFAGTGTGTTDDDLDLLRSVREMSEFGEISSRGG